MQYSTGTLLLVEEPLDWSSSLTLCIHIPALDFPGSMVIDKLSNFPKPIFPYLPKRHK